MIISPHTRHQSGTQKIHVYEHGVFAIRGYDEIETLRPFDPETQRSLYQDVSGGITSPGLDYYLFQFFDEVDNKQWFTAQLFGLSIIHQQQ